jgi:hypothetical protein
VKSEVDLESPESTEPARDIEFCPSSPFGKMTWRLARALYDVCGFDE